MIGVQLYAFSREAIETDLESILNDLSSTGYNGIEGPFIPNYREKLDCLGLRYTALHDGPLILKTIDQVIAYLHAMGGRDFCVSGPLDWDKRGYDDFLKTCEFLNEKGELLKKEGIRLHYHNHEFEFLPIRDGVSGMDILLENLNFEVASLCVDIGWVWVAGVDPADFLERHQEKISFIHLRDFHENRSVPLGQGDVPVSEIIATVQKLPNIQWMIVEHDPGSPDPIRDLKISRDFLSRF